MFAFPPADVYDLPYVLHEVRSTASAYSLQNSHIVRSNQKQLKLSKDVHSKVPECGETSNIVRAFYRPSAADVWNVSRIRASEEC